MTQRSIITPLTAEIETSVADEVVAFGAIAIAVASKTRAAIITERWRALSNGDGLVSPQYIWDTGNVPDGRYVVRLVASDERVNPADEVLDAEHVSEPVLVDNTAPTLLGVVAENGTVKGRARDEASVISSLAYNVDGGRWRVVFPSDRLFDDREETFEFSLPKDLKPRLHSVAVRARDAAGNAHVVAVTVRKGK